MTFLEKTRMTRRGALCGLAAGAALAVSLSVPATAQDKPTVRILINQSPWLNSFIAMVDEYQDKTGVKIDLDVTPFGGMVEKTRNSLRSSEGTYDIVNINSAGMAEMYASGYLKPIKEIDPNYSLPEGVLDFGGTAYWNFDTQSFDPNGTLLGLPTNGNVQVLYYRTDLYEKAGLTVPSTWDELLANGKKLNNPPDVYGFVPRAEKGSILYNWTAYLFSYGGSFFADPAKGDYSVTLASPEALQALEMYISLGKDAGPENFGAIAQAELAQLLATGKAAQAIAVVAIYSNLEDPNQSVVAGKIGTALLPAGPGGKHSSAAGHWMAGIPKNVPEANQKAALDFMKWFLERDSQIEYVKAGGVPVRSDLTGGGLEDDPAFAFLPAFSANAKVSQMNMPLIPGVQIRDAISLWLNRAVIGEITPTEALNGAAADANKILVDAGYKVRPPSKL
jgi:multiple sugar transport system substrate-binding protein